VKRQTVSERDAGVGNYPGLPPNLNLTQEQSTKFQDVRNAFFNDTEGLRSNIFNKEHDLDVVMHAKIIDSKKAEKIQDEISSLKAQIARQRLQAQLDARKGAI
jgi:Spy/CpxP family protein refolding chaperone